MKNININDLKFRYKEMIFEWNKENLLPKGLGNIHAEIWENQREKINKHIVWEINIDFEAVQDNSRLSDENEIIAPLNLFCGYFDFNIRDWKSLDGFEKIFSQDEISIGYDTEYGAFDGDFAEIKIHRIKEDLFKVAIKVYYEDGEGIIDTEFEAKFSTLHLSPLNIHFSSLEEAKQIVSNFMDLKCFKEPALDNKGTVWFKPNISNLTA